MCGSCEESFVTLPWTGDWIVLLWCKKLHFFYTVPHLFSTCDANENEAVVAREKVGTFRHFFFWKLVLFDGPYTAIVKILGRKNVPSFRFSPNCPSFVTSQNCSGGFPGTCQFFGGVGGGVRLVSPPGITYDTDFHGYT